MLDSEKYVWLQGYALIDVLHGSYEYHHEHAAYLEPLITRIQQSQVGRRVAS